MAAAVTAVAGSRIAALARFYSYLPFALIARSAPRTFSFSRKQLIMGRYPLRMSPALASVVVMGGKELLAR